jgi:hypothetical protein
MGKKRNKSGKDMPLQNRGIWWQDLSTLPPELKNEFWAAQTLFFMKRNGVLFLDPNKAEKYRATDRLEIDEHVYKEMVDPTSPMSQGGKANYFSSDWKSNPVYIHIENIVEAEIEKTGKQLEVNLTDKYAKTRQMKDNEKVVYRMAVRNLINDVADTIGIPKIGENEDPYKWIRSFVGKEESEGVSDKGSVDKFVDIIRNQISDQQDLALYNEYIYKCDYEIALELGIDYLLNKLNKWNDRWYNEYIRDLRHFNKAAGEWYTDQITGKPVIERFVPEKLWTNPFKRRDGEDLQFYFIEYDITFADFTKTMGRNMSETELKRVLMYQKTQGTTTPLNWVDGDKNIRDNSMIRVGKAAALTQDISSYIETFDSQIPMLRQMEVGWEPLNPNEKRIDKNFNVWYSWHYIPPTSHAINNSDYTWQAQYIFDLQKNQDQQRYGEGGRYAKPPLVIFDNSRQASFTDVVMAFMPKINIVWHKFQNCLVNDFKATIFSDDFIGGLLGAVDETNKISSGDPDTPTGGNGTDAWLEQWKMIVQSGKGFLRMRDSNGETILDPSKLVLNIDNGYLEKAERLLTMIAFLYNDMIKALAFSPVNSGEGVKPRTPVAGIEQSIIASESARFFLQKGYETFLKTNAERMVGYILQIAREATIGYKKRFEEFSNIIGYANGMALMGIADIPPEETGINVNYVDSAAKKEFIMNLGLEYVKTKELDLPFLELLIGIDNWKYAFVLMRMAVKQRKRELQAEQAQQQQYAMQLKQMDLQIAIQLQGAKSQATQQEIMTQGKVQDMINMKMNEAKAETQAYIKNLTTANRITETTAKLDKEAELESQKPFGS